ncbi:hypothetical protein ACIOGT_38045 [Streptomyces microflavus]|uniref:hypothetical protein n=1 Tax=Streptomyces microflavus TaxID=1919 RepID=UPI003807C757
MLLADGCETITDRAVLPDQVEVFDPVASTPPPWRPLVSVDERVLNRLRSPPPRFRKWPGWRGIRDSLRRIIPTAKAGGHQLPGLVLNIDAAHLTCHSGQQAVAPT